MSPDQVLVAAILAAIVIVAVVGAWRLMQRRDRSHEHDFGAGGRTSVPVGTRGLAATPLTPTGIVRAAGEEWSARSADGASIAEGSPVVVVGTHELALIVRPVAAGGAESVTDQR